MLIINKYHHQRGVVLIFTLVLLLLVTLTSASQIQQNRMELMMTAVLQQQTQRFAEAERVLRAVETYIDAQRYSDKNTYQCKTTTDGIYTQLPIQNNPTVNMTVTGLPFSLANVLTGVTLTNGSTAYLTKSACLSGNTESDCSNANSSACYSRNQSNCPTEIYTIEIKIRDDVKNERIIQSRYAVRCDTPTSAPAP